jgi:hypothetical protein
MLWEHCIHAHDPGESDGQDVGGVNPKCKAPGAQNLERDSGKGDPEQ